MLVEDAILIFSPPETRRLLVEAQLGPITRNSVHLLREHLVRSIDHPATESYNSAE